MTLKETIKGIIRTLYIGKEDQVEHKATLILKVVEEFCLEIIGSDDRSYFPPQSRKLSNFVQKAKNLVRSKQRASLYKRIKGL